LKTKVLQNVLHNQGKKGPSKQGSSKNTLGAAAWQRRVYALAVIFPEGDLAEKALVALQGHNLALTVL
jgi:hypothetical protein